MNPGYDTDHPPSRRKIGYDCMFCHNAYPAIPAGHQDAGSEPVFAGTLPEGIDCQRCHGPGSNHVGTAQRAGAKSADVRKAIVNPRRVWPPTGRWRCVCGATSKPPASGCRMRSEDLTEAPSLTDRESLSANS